MEIVVQKLLKLGVFVNKGDDSRVWIKNKYKKLVDFCYCCEKIGHTDYGCKVESI